MNSVACSRLVIRPAASCNHNSSNKKNLPEGRFFLFKSKHELQPIPVAELAVAQVFPVIEVLQFFLRASLFAGLAGALGICRAGSSNPAGIYIRAGLRVIRAARGCAVLIGLRRRGMFLPIFILRGRAHRVRV